MAYTSVIPVHRLDRSIEYVKDKEKTTQKADSLEAAIDYAMNRTKTEQYELAYSRDRRSTKIANYSDIELTDGEFSIEYSSLNELLFGKKVKFTLEDGTTRYGELRVKTTPKQSVKLTNGDRLALDGI